MQKRLTVKPHLSLEEVEQQYRTAKDPIAQSHWTQSHPSPRLGLQRPTTDRGGAASLPVALRLCVCSSGRTDVHAGCFFPPLRTTSLPWPCCMRAQAVGVRQQKQIVLVL